jgi:hypothetical protein
VDTTASIESVTALMAMRLCTFINLRSREMAAETSAEWSGKLVRYSPAARSLAFDGSVKIHYQKVYGRVRTDRWRTSSEPTHHGVTRNAVAWSKYWPA